MISRTFWVPVPRVVRFDVELVLRFVPVVVLFRLRAVDFVLRAPFEVLRVFRVCEDALRVLDVPLEESSYERWSWIRPSFPLMVSWLGVCRLAWRLPAATAVSFRL